MKKGKRTLVTTDRNRRRAVAQGKKIKERPDQVVPEFIGATGSIEYRIGFEKKTGKALIDPLKKQDPNDMVPSFNLEEMFVALTMTTTFLERDQEYIRENKDKKNVMDKVDQDALAKALYYLRERGKHVCAEVFRDASAMAAAGELEKKQKRELDAKEGKVQHTAGDGKIILLKPIPKDEDSN